MDEKNVALFEKYGVLSGSWRAGRSVDQYFKTVNIEADDGGHCVGTGGDRY